MPGQDITSDPNEQDIDTHIDGTILEGVTGGVDDKGIATFTIPYLAKSRATVLSVGNYHVLGLKPTTRSWEMLHDGTLSYKVTVIYKGHMDDQEPDEGKEVFSEKWSIDYDHSEEPLQAHPKYDEILWAYSGMDQNEPNEGPKFDKTISKRRRGSFGGANNLKTGDKNPLYGLKTYPLRQATVSRSYSTKDIPSRAIRNVDKIVRSIPGAPKGFNELTPEGRNWITGSPKITQEGEVWTVIESWKLSPPGGFPEVLFELIEG